MRLVKNSVKNGGKRLKIKTSIISDSKNASEVESQMVKSKKSVDRSCKDRYIMIEAVKIDI